MAIQRINLGTAPSGTGGDTNRSAFTKIDGNFADSANAASRLVGTATGNVMEVGAFGLGFANAYTQASDTTPNTTEFRTYATSLTGLSTTLIGVSLSWASSGAGRNMHAIACAGSAANPTWYTLRWGSNAVANAYKIRTEANTSVDANGFIKNASPIVKLFADNIELNDEAEQQDITFEKLGVGDYLVKGSTGFSQEGWYIEMPKDANGNVLVAVIYEQLENNDISVKTYAKKFDEETGDVVANTAKPRDIPSTRWIDLRLQALPQPDIKPFSADETVATNAE